MIATCDSFTGGTADFTGATMDSGTSGCTLTMDDFRKAKAAFENQEVMQYEIAEGEVVDFDDFEIKEVYFRPEAKEAFNPAILVDRRSQVHRRTVKFRSGCPPINRGRHRDRKSHMDKQ